MSECGVLMIKDHHSNIDILNSSLTNYTEHYFPAWPHPYVVIVGLLRKATFNFYVIRGRIFDSSLILSANYIEVRTSLIMICSKKSHIMSKMIINEEEKITAT